MPCREAWPSRTCGILTFVMRRSLFSFWRLHALRCWVSLGLCNASQPFLFLALARPSCRVLVGPMPGGAFERYASHPSVKAKASHAISLLGWKRFIHSFIPSGGAHHRRPHPPPQWWPRRQWVPGRSRRRHRLRIPPRPACAACSCCPRPAAAGCLAADRAALHSTEAQDTISQGSTTGCALLISPHAPAARSGSSIYGTMRAWTPGKLPFRISFAPNAIFMQSVRCLEVQLKSAPHLTHTSSVDR